MASSKTVKERIRNSALATSGLSIVAFYLGDRLGSNLHFDLDFDFIGQIAQGFMGLVANPFYIDLGTPGIVSGVVLFVVTWLIWLRYVVFIGNYRTGEESGSAKWGTEKTGSSFMDTKDKANNLLFTKNYGLALKQPKFNEETYRNLNVLVIGGSGSGKTKRYVKPNLMQLNSNYFVTDPKGTLIGETGYLFRDSGYKIKSFNTIEFEKSMHYNPLAYVKTDADILSFVNCLIKNTNDDNKTGGDAFWENSEKLFYTALIALLRDWYPKNYSLDGLVTLMAMAEASEEDENFKSDLDLIFEEIETGMVTKPLPKDKASGHVRNLVSRERRRGIFRKPKRKATTTQVPTKLKRVDGFCPGNRADGKTGTDPDEDFALANYKKFKVAAGKTLKSILISCNVRLAPIQTGQIRELLSSDEMELDKLGDDGSNMIVYAIMSDTDRTFSFLHAIMMWQTTNVLCNKALTTYGGRLPRLVNFIFDEFANIGTLPDVEKTVAVTRSRNIAMTIIIQSLSQLESRYEKDYKTIVDCCDTTLFLGGKSNDTNKELSEMIGKETIYQATFSETNGQSPSGSKNMQIQGRDLIDAAEIGKMSRTKAILLIAGADPLMDDKYQVEDHPNYVWLDPGSNPKCMYAEPFDFVKYRDAVRAMPG